MSSAGSLYMSVINDVVTQVRESFLDEDLDDNMLEELKIIWRTKLEASNTIEHQPPPQLQVPTAVAHNPARAGVVGQQPSLPSAPANLAAGPAALAPVAAAPAAASSLVFLANQIVALQINVPPQPENPTSQPRTLVVKVPAHAVQESGSSSALLQALLREAISYAVLLPDLHATNYLQTQINNAFNLRNV